jgi:hypothetical protein
MKDKDNDQDQDTLAQHTSPKINKNFRHFNKVTVLKP